MLLQVRNLLATLVSVTLNQAGQKTTPNDFIPRRENPDDQLERQRSEMLTWAARRNASLN